MKYTELGKTGWQASVLALGCWQFGGGPYWGDRDERESIATIRAALDEGINLFDTAEAYADGYSEIVLGRALAGQRHQALIATKVSPANLSRDGVQRACENSLRRLNTDYIDLYQVHWPNHEVPLSETMASLESLRGQGKVRAIGVSNFGVGDLTEALANGRIETNQLPYSLLWRAIEYEIAPECLRHGVGILCYSPLAQGLLTGSYTCADEVPEGRACTRLFADVRPGTRHGQPGCEPETFATIDALRRLADEAAVPMSSIALAWLLQQPGVSAAIVGARNPTQLRANLHAADLSPAPDMVRRLGEATEALKHHLGPNPDMWQSQSRYR